MIFSSTEARKALQEIKWEDGKTVTLAEGPYRYRMVLLCSSLGRQKAMFANGEHAYFCYVELVSANGQWIEKGTGVVPVLPDGRFVMVVEQRPAQSRYPNQSQVVEIGGQYVDLGKFGPYSSLEFPGGHVDPNEGLMAGFLRELVEETGVDRSGLLYRRRQPIYGFGSDIACAVLVGVIFLSGLSYAEHVEIDGGLNVLALTRDEVESAIWSGIIHSGQAALLEWSFFKEVKEIRKNPALERKLIRAGYLVIEKIAIAK